MFWLRIFFLQVVNEHLWFNILCFSSKSRDFGVRQYVKSLISLVSVPLTVLTVRILYSLKNSLQLSHALRTDYIFIALVYVPGTPCRLPAADLPKLIRYRKQFSNNLPWIRSVLRLILIFLGSQAKFIDIMVSVHFFLGG